MSSLHLFTIGFTRKTAQKFFQRLQEAGVRRVVDVRLNNTSQLSGFAKRNDLQYFLHEIADIDYAHMPVLAPTQEILDAYKKEKADWAGYEDQFETLMKARRIEDVLRGELRGSDCLLCSEDHPKHCHRRLVVEYLRRHWPEVQVTHL